MPSFIAPKVKSGIYKEHFENKYDNYHDSNGNFHDSYDELDITTRSNKTIHSKNNKYYDNTLCMGNKNLIKICIPHVSGTNTSRKE